MRTDLLCYLPDDNLVKLDRAAMANSLECRIPLLDYRVVEAALRLPRHQRVRNGQGKWLLRELLSRRIPRSLFERPKMGFSVPVSRWLREELRPWLLDTLNPTQVESDGYFDSGVGRQIINEHMSGRFDHGRGLWALAMFMSWNAQRVRRP